jgi:hypothetical protein
MRYLLIACLISGCSAAGPTAPAAVGPTAKDLLSGFMYRAAVGAGSLSSTAACISAGINALSDTEAARINATIDAGSPVGSVPELVRIINACPSR